MRGKRIAGLGALVAALAVVPNALAGSLPSVSSGQRPGPAILYAKPAHAPQLDNVAPWHAAPILVSGAAAYRRGEWLYQDYLYDDHGATGVPDPNTPYSVSDFLFSPPAGTFTYPTNSIYGDNAADLVELRVKPTASATAFRVTLNTLKDPALVGFTIALGDDGVTRAWPHGAGVTSPARLFLTVHGTSAELLDGASGRALAPAPSVSVSLHRRQFYVLVPHAAWDPGDGSVRTTIGVGLWDAAHDRYLKPTIGQASATAPGGGSLGGAALVNVGPRLHEPMPLVRELGAGVTIGDAAVGGMVQGAWWREKQQATALSTGDVSAFYANVDFAKLARRVDDDYAVPRTGPIDRILASHYEFGQGFDPSKVCFRIAPSFDIGSKCLGRLVGQLQPYALYVPPRPRPAGGWGLTLLLHSLSANYNQFLASRNQSQLGDRSPGSLIITPSARSPDGGYAGITEADTFEVWADVARRYRLDPTLTDVSGYSMGGFGTFRLLTRYPDLFARGFSVVGAPAGGGLAVTSPATVANGERALRNTPLLMWNSTADELVPVAESLPAAQELGVLGLRFTYDLFNAADHLTLATNDQYLPGAAFLGAYRVDRNPQHVSYVATPSDDNAQATAIGDHAYWVSKIRERDPKRAGVVDARSLAFGVGDPRPLGVKQSAGLLLGGSHGPMPFVERSQDWGPSPRTPALDQVVIELTNVASVTIDAARARLTCAADVVVHSDGPARVDLACPATRHHRARVRRIFAG